MTRTLLWAVGGLFMAGAIHFVAVLAIPSLAPNDAFALMQRFGEVNRLHVIAPMTPQTEPLPGMDPSMRYAVCRYDISTAPLRIVARIPATYWVATFYDRHGVSFYTINDRSIASDRIELWLATKEQLLNDDLTPDDDEQARLVIGAPAQTGFVLIRLIVQDPSLEASAREALADSQCGSLEITGSPSRSGT